MSFKKLAVILAIFMVCYLENVSSRALRQESGSDEIEAAFGSGSEENEFGSASEENEFGSASEEIEFGSGSEENEFGSGSGSGSEENESESESGSEEMVEAVFGSEEYDESNLKNCTITENFYYFSF